MKSVFSKRLWSVVVAAAGLFTSPLSATLTVKAATECARESGADGVRTAVNATEWRADGVGARKAATRSGSYPWEGKTVVDASECYGLSDMLSDGANDGKVIRITDDIYVGANITSSINATIDLDGHAIHFDKGNYSIKVTDGCLNIYDSSTGGTGVVNISSTGIVLNVHNGATLNFYGGTLKGDDRGTGIWNNGTVTVEGGEFEKLSMCINNEGTLNIKGGTFKGDKSGTGVKNTGTVTVEGGEFKNLLHCIYNENKLTIENGVFDGNGSGTGVYNDGTATVKGGTFSKFKKAIDNANKLTIEGGDFVGNGGMTGVYNSGTATVSGGTFKTYVMGIYNAGTLNLQALPTVGTGDDANATADIGLAAGKVITMAGEISSLPEDYAKIKVGQFSYSESSGYEAAGSVPYVVTAGYKDKVKGIHPAIMFQAVGSDVEVASYADDPDDEIAASNVGEAVVLATAGDDAQIFADDGNYDADNLQNCVDFFPENATNAVIKLLRNVDLGGGNVTVVKGSAAKPVVIDLNGHLLTSNSGDYVINVKSGTGLTIRDSGSGGAIVNTNTDYAPGIYNRGGTITVEGGSISTFYRSVDNSIGTLTVTGGTFTGGGNAVYNSVEGTATISGGTFIMAKSGSSPIFNDGTMELGCGAGAVTVLGRGGSDAVGNKGALTVGKNVTITNGNAAGIYNKGTLTVKGFPKFDAGNACDIRLVQSSNGPNSLISFTDDISGWPANLIKIKILDSGDNAVTLGTSGLTLTKDYAAHVKRGGSGADKDRPLEPGQVFTVLGVADGTYLLLSGGEAVAYAGSFPVAEVKSANGTDIYNIGTGAYGYSTAAGALVQAVYAADRVDDDTTVKMLCDVDLGSEWLDFTTSTSAVGDTPENAKKMTLDLNGFELSGCRDYLIDNSVYSLTVVNTGTRGGILQYRADGACIYNSGALSVKDVALSASGESVNRIFNLGTLTIDGEMKFLGSEDANDVYLAYGKTLGIGESLNLEAKLKVYVEDATIVPRKLTTGYGTTVRTPATATTPSKVKAPDEVFTVTNIGTNKLAFAGGEAWVVPSGTLALIETDTGVDAYSNSNYLANDIESLNDDSKVMLTDDVTLVNKELWFNAANKRFTLDLGGHKVSSNYIHTVLVISGALLDIIDTGGGGCIINTCDNGKTIENAGSFVSIPGGINIKASGTDGRCIYSSVGTTTLTGWPTFELGADAECDIILTENDVITFTDAITAAPKDKISVKYYEDKFGTLTSGYGAHVKYPAGHAKQGEPIDPEEVFTYKPAGTLVASVHAKLEGSDDAAEAAFWMPTMAVPYIDATGTLHDNLTNPGGTGEKDAALAYILDGTETTLGQSGTDTWYVALPGVKSPGYDDFIYYDPIELKGDVHLLLADGCDMRVYNSNNRGCIYGDATTSLTIYSQSDDYGKSRLELDPYLDGAAGIRARTVTINGGLIEISGNAIFYCTGIIADGGGLTINGGLVDADVNNGLYALDCGLIVNGGEVRASTSYGGDCGICCFTNGAHSIDINGGKVSAEGDKAAIWATKNINIKSDVTAECTGENGYGIYSDYGDINISGGKINVDAYKEGSHGIYADVGNVSITAGQVESLANHFDIYAGTDIFLSLSESTDFIKSHTISALSSKVKIPAGQYLGVIGAGNISNEVFGSADADYVFGENGHPDIDDISVFPLSKAYPVAGSGKYLACDRTDADWLLSGSTVALYPTGVKFNEKLDGTITAEVILSETPLAGVPKGRAVILANATADADLGKFSLVGWNKYNCASMTPAENQLAYDNGEFRLPNFIATDGAKTFAELIGEATGATVSTAEQARDYIVFTLTGDRFVPITFTYDDTPAAGHCLLVVPKINILLHQDITAAAGGSSSGARRISLGGSEGSDTGVKEVIRDSEIQDDTYFGLDGRRLNAAPTKKGIYIRRGSKVVIK